MPDEEQQSPVDGDGAMADDEGETEDAPLGEGDASSVEDSAAPSAEPDAEPDIEPSNGKVFSVYGVVSTVLALVSVAAVVVGFVTWSIHRGDVDERVHRSEVLQTAATWTNGLINLNADNVEKGMQRLRDKTVGELKDEFDAVVDPYRKVVQQIKSRSVGRIEAAAIVSAHHGLDVVGSPGPAEQPPPSGDGRTDEVMVIATSIAENVGGKPGTVHWALQLDVVDVDGQLLISRLKSIR